MGQGQGEGVRLCVVSVCVCVCVESMFCCAQGCCGLQSWQLVELREQQPRLGLSAWRAGFLRAWKEN